MVFLRCVGNTARLCLCGSNSDSPATPRASSPSSTVVALDLVDTCKTEVGLYQIYVRIRTVDYKCLCKFMIAKVKLGL